MTGSAGGAEFSDLFSRDELAEYAILVSKITDAVVQRMEQGFETPLITSVGRNEELTLKPGDANPNSTQADPVSHVSQELQSLEKLSSSREAQIPEDSLAELKEAAMKFVREWQMDVLSRLGEVVNLRDKSDKVQSSAPAGDALQSGKQKASEKSEHDATNSLADSTYPAIASLLSQLSLERRTLLLNSTLLFLLSLKEYTSQSRALMLQMTSSLSLPFHLLMRNEINIAKTLLESVDKNMSAEKEMKLRASEDGSSRKWKVGLASVAGAAIIGITGGLAAPLVAAGLGSILGGLGLGATAAAGLLGALAESSLLIGGLFGAYGSKMTGRMMEQYAKEVEDFSFIPLHREINSHMSDLSINERRLRVTIVISGWQKNERDVTKPWEFLGPGSENFALQWELRSLLQLGSALESVIKSAAWGAIKKELISRTIFATLMSALWPLSFLKVGRLLDNPFSVAKYKADKAGIILADALMSRTQGSRPVTLIGYSLGARVIYSCLLRLVECRSFGLIETCVLMGAPTPSEPYIWRTMKSVIAGRLINVYSQNDYILSFLYRTSSIQLGVAGLQAIKAVEGIENKDVSSLVAGHLDYQTSIVDILKCLDE